MKINAHIGMEDPATTGYILAFYSILPDKKKKQITVISSLSPDGKKFDLLYQDAELIDE